MPTDRCLAGTPGVLLKVVLDKFELLSGAWSNEGQLRIPQVRVTLRELLDGDVFGTTLGVMWPVDEPDRLGHGAGLAACDLLKPAMAALQDARPIHDGLNAAIAGEYRGLILAVDDTTLRQPAHTPILWNTWEQPQWELHRMRCLLDSSLLDQTFIYAEARALDGDSACNDAEADGWMRLAWWCERRMRAG